MEMWFQVGPKPRTLKAALQALQLAQARFSVALDWIKRSHGKLPVTFQTELRNEDYFIRKSWETPPPPKNNQSGHTNTSEFSGRVPALSPVSPDPGDNYDDWGPSNPVSPSPGAGDPLLISRACPVPALPDDTVRVELVAADTPTISHEVAGTVATSHGLIKVVDIRKITDASIEDIPIDMHQINDKSIVVKPIFITPTLHTCPHCTATFVSASALSVHSLVHVQLRLNRMRITQNRLENLHKYPRLFTIQYVNDKVVVVKRKAIPFNPKPKIFLPVSQLSPHNLEKSLVYCEFCPRRFYSKTLLTCHVNSAHKTRIPRTCQFCPLSFPTGAERYEHIKTNHAERICHKCDKCGLSFLESDRLTRHLAMVHPDPSLALTCEICGKVCKSAHVLKLHLKQSHPDPSQAVTCPTCGIQLKSARILKTHIRCHNPRSFLCQLCGYAAKNPAPLINHMRVVHGTARPHKCPNCPLAFKTAVMLRHHVDRHFGKNLVPCPHCDVRKSSKDMYNHVNIVHKGRKFKCAQCPAMFSLRAHLKNHYVLKHPDVTIPPDADLEVIYTKTPEDSAVQAPPPAKRKPRVTMGPHSVKPRQVGKLSCETCPGATFISNDEFELHIRRHEKDPEYKMKHRHSIQRLDQFPPTPQITEEYASSRAVAEQEAPPLQVEVHPVPVPMPPLLVEPPMHQHTDPQPQLPLVTGGTTLSQQHNLINPYPVDMEFPFYAL